MNFRQISAIALCLILTFMLAGCSLFASEEEDDFEPAEIPIESDIPVDEAEVIAFFNNVISYIQKDNSFPEDKKPGIKTSESLGVDNGSIRVLTADGSEDSSLDGLNAAAKKIKDEIIGGIDISFPVIHFGDTSAKASEVIYPYDSDIMALSADDVEFADCTVDADNLHILITLSNTPETIGKIFGIRDKTEIIDLINKTTASYALVNDYEIDYNIEVPEGDSPVKSTIALSCEVEQQDDGSYKCTGRITEFKYTVNEMITAYISCGGSFADFGDITLKCRLNDTRSYDFDWYGSAVWEE